MSYVKGDWNGKRIDLSVHYFESIKTEVCFTGRTEVAVANAKRIVDCVNACDGMENPADDIAKLRRERDELLRVMIAIKADCDEASSYGDKVCVATLEIDRVLELCGGK